MSALTRRGSDAVAVVRSVVTCNTKTSYKFSSSLFSPQSKYSEQKPSKNDSSIRSFVSVRHLLTVNNDFANYGSLKSVNFMPNSYRNRLFYTGTRHQCFQNVNEAHLNDSNIISKEAIEPHSGQGAGGGEAPNDGDDLISDESDGDEDSVGISETNIISCYKTLHQDNFGLDKQRFFITCCQEIQLKSNEEVFDAICLLDVGSSLGYITLELARRCKLKQAGSWEGEISTLHGTKPGIYPIFIVDLLDRDGKIISVKFLGSPRIGHKEALPTKLFKKLCSEFRLPLSSVQNVGGEISLLLGLDQCSLLADKVVQYTNQDYPELYVCTSVLSHSYIFCGALGRNASRILCP